MEYTSLNYQDWLTHQSKHNGYNEYNSVLRLREYELFQATKPFRARGFKLKRCHRCLIAISLCVCNKAICVEQSHRFILVMYRGEAIKPSNTGRLIAEILPNTLAFQWGRTSVDQELLLAISDDQYDTYIVFPERYAYPAQEVLNREAFSKRYNSNRLRKMQFIILDGTWSEAKKMFRKSEYLKGLPLLSINETDAHEYMLREASREEQLGTVSVALSILKMINETKAFTNLLSYTDEFIRRYLSSKARNPKHLVDNLN
ncbi:tRNA-uridine aminocarboxypropyltransferase [Thorsellia kenyensis]|uniref:tRNA-uridine aminocarboxypropyltransferase n=1 Tax=Thorsellia kenyensis TaxID=1549888 RepID=A0ABV6CF78_9GAMM